MIQRILTAAVGLIIFFAALFSGETVFTVAITVIILLALCEMLYAAGYGKELFALSLISSAAIMAGMIFDCTVFVLIISVMLFFGSGGISSHQVYI